MSPPKYLKAGLYLRVNFWESYREHLSTTFRRDSKSWLARSLRLLLRAPELRDLSEYEVSVYTWVNACWLESKNMTTVVSADCEKVGAKWGIVLTLIRMARLQEAKLAAAVCVALAINKGRKVKRKCWVKNSVRRRDRQGTYTQLIRELQLEDAQQFTNFTGMSDVEVQSLVNMLGLVIGKQDTAMRNAISVEERVIVTLQFLATGKK